MTIYDVFISYRRKDGSGLAESVAEYLRGKGLRVFFDKSEIKDNQDFKERIEVSLRQAPVYLLVATTGAFEFYVDQEDWVRKEMEIACEGYDGNSGRNRVISVVVPQGAVIPRENDLPENIRSITVPNRIMLEGALPTDGEKGRILKAVTEVNRHNLWNAGHRWLEESKEKGGRFAALDINTALFPNAEKRVKMSRSRRNFPINIKSSWSDGKLSLMKALSMTDGHIYLIGQGGIGKTTALVHIMNGAYGEGCGYTESCQIPLFVSLSTAPDTYGALYEGGRSTFIKRAIYKQIREDRTAKKVSRSEIAKLDEAFTADPETAVVPVMDILSKQTGAPEYLLLLDGLNEVSRANIEEVDRSVIQMIIQEINRLMEDCPNVRIILTGRADEAVVNGEKLTRLELSGVDSDVVGQYLSSCECEQTKIDSVLENKALLETLSVPLFLVMYGSLRQNGGITTQGEILRTFFNENKESLSVYTVQSRLSQVETDVERSASAVQKMRITAEMQSYMLDFLLPEIAWYMESRNLFALDEETVGEIIEPILNGVSDLDIGGRYGKQIFEKYRSSGSAKEHTRKIAKDILSKLGSDIEEVTESFIDCCMLSLGVLASNNGKYGFIHQHIRDYFASQKVVNNLWLAVCLYENCEDDSAHECLCQVLKDKPLSFTLRRFVGESLGEHKNKPLCADGQWQYAVPDDLCERSLLDSVLNVERGRFGDDLGYCVHSLIECIKYSREDLSGMCLQQLDLSNSIFNGVTLGRPSLAADMSESKLYYSNILPLEYGFSAFTPDGKYIVSSSQKYGCSLWDTWTGVLKCTYLGEFVGFDEGGRLMTFDYYARNVRLWNLETRECEKDYDISDMIRPELYNHVVSDGTFLLTWLWNDVNVRNLKTGKTFNIKVAADGIADVTVSRDRKRIIVKALVSFKSSWGNINVSEHWDIESGEYIETVNGWDSFHPKTESVIRLKKLLSGAEVIDGLHGNTVHSFDGIYKSVAYSCDGRFILAVPENRDVEVYDAKTFEKVQTLQESRSIYGINTFLFDDGRFWAISDSLDGIRIWNLISGELIRLHPKAMRTQLGAAYDGYKIVVTDGVSSVLVWDTVSEKFVYDDSYRVEYQLKEDILDFMLFSPVDVVSNATGEVLFSMNDRPIIYTDPSVKSFDGRFKYLSRHWRDDSEDSEIDIRRILDNSVFGKMRLVKDEHLNFLTVNEDCTQMCQIITADYTKRVEVWNTVTWELVHTIDNENEAANTVAYNHDGTRFAVAYVTGVVKVFDAKTFECLQIIPNISGLCVHGVDMRNLANGSRFSDEDKRILRMYGAIID